MSVWDERKAELLQTIGEAEKALTNRSDGSLGEEDAAAMTKVLAVAKARLGAAPAVLIAPEAAGHIESGAKRLIALLQSGAGDTPRDIVGLLAVGSAWITHTTHDEDLGSAAFDVAAAARERLGALDAQIAARGRELDQRAKLIDDDISTVRADLEALRASLVDLDTKRVESESAIQNALTTQAEAFRAAQKEREESFTASIGESTAVAQMNEPGPAVLEAIAQLARDLPDVDADEAWARLAHLTPEQRAEVERVIAPPGSLRFG